MDANQLVLNLYAWRQTIEVLLQDTEAIKQSPVKLPNGYTSLLHFLYEGSKSMEYLARSDLKKCDIRILGEHQDSKEFFVMWKHQSETQLLRIAHSQLRIEAQARVEDLMKENSNAV